MTRYLLAGAAALALMSGSTLAQPSSETVIVAPSPAVTPAPGAPSYSSTTTTQRVDPNGVETDQTKSFQKSQAYTDDGGTISARTTTRTMTQQTVNPPPVLVPPAPAMVPPPPPPPND
jgi:hypothetical protein